MNKIALVSAATDDYAELLAEMLCSLRGCQVTLDIKIFDLGLGTEGRQKIVEAADNRSLQLMEPDWTIPIDNREKTPPVKKIYLAKPFIPDFFPGYDGYIWADADLWFQDTQAIEHYIQAAQQYGSAFCFESHPLYKSPTKFKYFRILNFFFVRVFKNYLFNNVKRMFGKRVALKMGLQPVLNSGVFYISAQSPIWSAWQHAIQRANLSRHHRFDQICDQTCLQVAIFENGLKHGILPAIFNWLPNYCVPTLDKDSGALVDPVYPHPKIQVIHFAGVKDSLFTVPFNDGTYQNMTLRWSELSKLSGQYRLNSPYKTILSTSSSDTASDVRS